MKRPRLHRPSPALIVACTALFVALGGTVMAATEIDGHTIRVGSEPGNRLEANTVTGDRLKNASIPGGKLKPQTVTGTQVDSSTLGNVPSSTHATSADTARHASTATAADHADDATTINGHAVGCAAGRRQFAGACWDVLPSAGTATVAEAAAACAAQGGELPAPLTLLTFLRQSGVGQSLEGEWVNEVIFVNPSTYDVPLVDSAGRVNASSTTTPHQFRCVTPFVS